MGSWPLGPAARLTEVDHDDAMRTAEEWAEKANRNVPSLLNLTRALADAGNNAQAQELLDEAIKTEGYWDSAPVGYAYVALNDFDLAFEWLEKSYEARDWGILNIRTEPYRKIYIDNDNWIRFRNDPRYRDLIKLMNFPPFPPEHPGYADDQTWLARKAAVEE